MHAGFDTPLGIAVIIAGMLFRYLRYRDGYEEEVDYSRVFLICLAVIVVLIGGFFWYGWAHAGPERTAEERPPLRTQEMKVQARVEWRDRLAAEAQAEYEALEKTRQTLNPKDAKAVKEFNARAAHYRQTNTRLKQATAQAEKATAQLQKLQATPIPGKQKPTPKSPQPPSGS